MPTPSLPPDLIIEIGKAQASARAAGEAINKVEKQLSDRMDRFEDKVEKSLGNLEDKFEAGLNDIKKLLNDHHTEITSIKIKSSHDDGIVKHKNESRSNTIAICAVVISFIAALSSVFGPMLSKL